MTKKRKISGLTGIELMHAYSQLKKLKNSLDNEPEDNNQEEASTEESDDKLSEELDRILATMESKLLGPQALNFSGVNEETLEKMNIVYRCSLKLKSGIDSYAEQSKENGKDKLWSSKQMYLHLSLLETLLPRKNETTCRAWIDTFFFRVSSMVPPGKRMILNMEQNIPATVVVPSSMSTITGFTDYTAVVANEKVAPIYFNIPSIATAKRYNTGFFVTEAKKDVDLVDHIPQAVCQLYASSKQLDKPIIRGALTNGHAWVFIILYLNNDGDGAFFKHSNVIPLTVIPHLDGREPTLLEPWPDVIAGILSYWVQRSFEDLTEDDWFEEVG